MKKVHCNINGMPILGIMCRVSGEDVVNEIENPADSTEKGAITRLWERYIKEDIGSSIPNRKEPGVTYCVYYNYQEEDHFAKYDCLIGEEVTVVDALDRFELARIQCGDYMKFTTPAGPIAKTMQNAWQTIWGTPSKELGWRRKYDTDFEIYDIRARNPDAAVMDIYLSVKPR